MYIVLEGVDGSGKSTVATMVHEFLLESGRQSVLTKHPGSTKLGAELRHIIKHRTDVEVDRFTEQLLMFADHSAFVNQILRPSIEKEIIVIADRSNLIGAYPYGMAGGVRKDEIAAFHNTMPDMPKIDLLIVFQCPWAVAKDRVSSRDEECRIESRGDKYFEKVTEMYNTLLEMPEIKSYTREIVSVDATQSLEKVFEDTVKHIGV